MSRISVPTKPPIAHVVEYLMGSCLDIAKECLFHMPANRKSLRDNTAGHVTVHNMLQNELFS